MKLYADRPRPLREQRAEMAHQPVQDRVAPPEFMRPRILAGHDPARVVGEVVGERRAAAAGGVGVDLLHEFLVGCGAHGGFSVDWRLPIIAPRQAFFQSIVNMIYIHLMNLNSLDLNLLVALDALLQGSQCQPRRDADRAVAAGGEPRAAAAARGARRSPAGAHRRADGIDAAGASAARAAGAGARPGARAVHSRRFRRGAEANGSSG